MSIESRICTQCDKEILPDFEQSCIQAGVDVCPDCRICSHCDRMVTVPELLFSLKYNLPIRHSRCHAIARVPNKTVEISVEELELLNLCRLIVLPDEDLSQETNSIRAGNASYQLWEHLTIEKKYLQTHMMERVYGDCYTRLKKDPSDVKAKLLERDKERMN